MAKMQFPKDTVFPLVIFCHQRAIAAIETQAQVNKILGVIDDGTWCNKKMVVVRDLVFHEPAMLEMSVK